MLIAYALTKYQKDGEEKTKWTPVGTAWKNKDGSLNVELEALPVSGRLQIRQAEEKKEPSR
jgi:hypothetical protein